MSEWLGSIVKELAVPGSPWYTVRTLLAARFAERVRLEGFTREQLIIVEKFVGEEFLREHKLYRETNWSPREKSPISEEKIQVCLKDLMVKAGKDANCSFATNLDDRPDCFDECIAIVKNMSIHNTYKLVSKDVTNQTLYPILLKTSQDSELLGQQMVQILQADSSKLNAVVQAIKDKPMSVSLRRYIYRLLLIKRKKRSSRGSRSNSNSSVEISQLEIRKQFAQSVKQGLIQLKIKDATKSPVSYLISSSIVESFTSIKGLEIFSEDLALQQQTLRVLNIFYTAVQKFEYYYVLWCLPLQVVLSKENSPKEHDIEIAMWLDILRECIPQPAVLEKIVTSVWKIVTSADFLGGKLKTHFWAMGLGLKDSEVKTAFGEDYQQRAKGQIKPTLHSIIVIRNWLLYLFVGCTSMRVTLFFWDQLFYSNWDISCFKRICITLISCLEHEIITCKEKKALFDVLTNSGNDLTLAKISETWKLYADL